MGPWFIRWFKTIGWRPDGDVRGSYAVSTTSTDFTATGLSDVDGDVVLLLSRRQSQNANSPTNVADVY